MLKPLFLFVFFISSCNFFAKKDPILVQISPYELSLSSFSRLLKNELTHLNFSIDINNQKIKHVKKRITNDFIYQSLIKIWAQKNNLFIHPKTLEKTIISLKKNYPSPELFTQELAKNKILESDWIQAIQFNLLEQKVHQSITPKHIILSEDEIKNYYQSNLLEFKISEKIKIRQLTTTNRLAANNILDAARQGFSLVSYLKKYTDDKNTRTSMDTLWVDAHKNGRFSHLLSLKKNEFSEIYSTEIDKDEFRFHIAQIIDRKEAKTLSFEESKKKILALYKGKNQKYLLTNWLKAQIKDIKILVNNELINNIKIKPGSL